MTAEQKALLENVEHMCQRPGMYFGAASINLCEIYLRGLEHGYELAGKPWLLMPFFGWVIMKCGVHSEAFGFARSLWHKHGSESAALKAVPQLLREYLELLETKSEDEICAEVSAWENAETKRRWSRVSWTEPVAEDIASVLHDG